MNFMIDGLAMKKARPKTFLIIWAYCAMFSLSRFDDCSFLFLNTYFNNDSLSAVLNKQSSDSNF